MSLKGKTLFITGGSRGIGLAIALRAARDGANVAIAAKTTEPHPKLPGTIYTSAKAVDDAGGRGLPLVVDVRDEASVYDAVEETVRSFGGIDICINNASAISLTGTLDTEMKRYDLMHAINTRGTFLTTRACLPHLLKAANPHVLALAPPLDLNPEWFGPHVAYTISKFGMSLCMLGMAEEFRGQGVAFNGLWPMSMIDTAAVRNVVGDRAELGVSRTPEIMADAAHAILTKPSRSFTGRFLLDELLLRDEGVTDFEPYATVPGAPLRPDLFVGDDLIAASGLAYGPRDGGH